MANTVESQLIVYVLFPVYGDSLHMQYLMRPENRLQRNLITSRLLLRYQDLYRTYPGLETVIHCNPALDSCLINILTDYIAEQPQDLVDATVGKILREGPNPPSCPNFIKDLFTHE